MPSLALDPTFARAIEQDGELAANLGERLADRVARLGGSWSFILVFLTILVGWIVLNTEILGPRSAFDPYPYIFLNLLLSMIAALQAPVIMMSQNRQSEKDRRRAMYDYQINLKAELEIRELHAKLDQLREREWSLHVALQQQQIEMLNRLLDERSRTD